MPSSPLAAKTRSDQAVSGDIPVHGGGQALVEPDLRSPAEDRFDLRGLDEVTPVVARAVRYVLGPPGGIKAEPVQDPVDDVEVGALLPGADVAERQLGGAGRRAGRDGAEVGVQHPVDRGAVVLHVQPAPHLQPVPVHGYLNRSWLANCGRVLRDTVLGSGLAGDIVRDLL
jgi:hypothetical protein